MTTMKATKQGFRIATTIAVLLLSALHLQLAQVQVQVQAATEADRFIGTDGNRGTEEDAIPEDKFGCIILGQSGKFRCSQGRKGRNAADGTNWFSIELAGLTERDANGNTVGLPFMEFASTDFTFSDFEETTLGDSAATKITFDATLGEGFGNVSMTTYMVESEGTFTVGNDTVTVVKHDIKWTTKVEGWDFASNDGSLDIDMLIMGPRSGKSIGENEFNFGVDIDTAGAVEIDGKEVEVETGYPKLITTGNQEVLRVRVPSFENYATYDPVAKSSTMEDDGTSDDDEENAGYTTFVASTVASAMAAIGSVIIALVIL